MLRRKIAERFAHYCVDTPSRRQFGRRLLGFFAGIGLLGRETARQKLIMMNTFSFAGLPLSAQVAALHPDTDPWQRVQVKVLMAV